MHAAQAHSSPANRWQIIHIDMPMKVSGSNGATPNNKLPNVRAKSASHRAGCREQPGAPDGCDAARVVALADFSQL
jgi:hypothetical protein